jgi:pimeloyl-ACP methyl ester carboxylesterase
VLSVALGLAAAVLLAAHPQPAAPAGDWSGTVTHAGKTWPVRLRVWNHTHGLRACFDFPDYGLYYRCTSAITETATSLAIRYASGQEVVLLEGAIDDGAFAGAWKGLGVDATFTLVRSGAAGDPVVEEPVRFRNGEVELSGTLLRPAGLTRRPAVVWAHGSGPQHRSEDFYRDRGYLLADHGIAALIYDKRGVGESTGERESTLDELAGDAVAAVQYLQSRPDIETSAVGVGGFSQGGYVAPLAASRYGRIAFVVVGAAPGISPADQNDFAARSALERRRVPPAVLDEVMRLRRDVLRAQETGEQLDEVEQRVAAARVEAWFGASGLPRTPIRRYGSRGLSVLRFDPLTAWRGVRVPVWAAWGADDALVPAALSRDRIGAALRESGNPDVTMRLFTGAGHGLAVAATPGAWDWPRLAPGFHDSMVAWIRSKTPPRTGTR